MAKSIRALKVELKRAMNRYNVACRAHAVTENGEALEQAARRDEAANAV